MIFLLLACTTSDARPGMPDDHQPAPLPPVGAGQAAAVFAGGCFWCMESDFDKLAGVVATTSGYDGGTVAHPTYEQVGMHLTGHREAVRVVYDTSKLSYDQVLDWFWHHVDPTDTGGQFCDRGEPYKTGIFYADDVQKQAAEASKKAIDDQHILPGPIVTEILPVNTFWPAEIYHQDYHQTNPARYEPYRLGCGRDAKVLSLWGMH